MLLTATEEATMPALAQYLMDGDLSSQIYLAGVASIADVSRAPVRMVRAVYLR